MSQSLFKYIIVGGGLAGASAVEGIREIDRDGSIQLIGRESRLPYHRPPLSKKLWTGAKKVEDILSTTMRSTMETRSNWRWEPRSRR